MTIVKANEIVKNIKDLPPLPLVVQKLLKVVGDVNTSAKDVADVLSTDQAMTSKVLKLVNSAFYGLPGKVSTISRAVVILGNAAVRNLALAFASYDALKKIGGERVQERFWGHALTCAVGAQEMALRMKHHEAEEAFTAGLLHDLGHLILITFLLMNIQQSIQRLTRISLKGKNRLWGLPTRRLGASCSSTGRFLRIYVA